MRFMTDDNLFNYLPENAKGEFLAEARNALKDAEHRIQVIKAIKLCHDFLLKARREGILSLEEWIYLNFDVPKSECFSEMLRFLTSAMDSWDFYAFAARRYASCPSAYGRFFIALYAVAIISNIQIGQKPETMIDELFSFFPNEDSDFMALKTKILNGEKIPFATPLEDALERDSYSGAEGIEAINKENIRDFVDIDTLRVPSSVSEIDWYAVNACECVNSIVIDPKNEYLRMIDGNVYDRFGSVLLRWLSDEPVADIPEGVLKIGIDALSFKKNLERINFPSTLVNFEYGRFYGFSGCFYNCPKLKTVSFKGRIVYIPTYLVEDFESIVFCSKWPPSLIGEIVCYGTHFPNIIVPQESLELYKKAPVWKRYAGIIRGDKEFKPVAAEKQADDNAQVDEKEAKNRALAENKLFLEVFNGFSGEQRERIFQNARNIVKEISKFDYSLFFPSVEQNLNTLVQRLKKEDIPGIEFVQEIFDALAYECYAPKINAAMEKAFGKVTDMESRYYAFLWKKGFHNLVNKEYFVGNYELLNSYIQK